MKDYPYWRDALNNAKTLLSLRAVGEDLNRFQKQTEIIEDEAKLKPAQVESLRKLYLARSNKLKAEALPPPVQGNPKPGGFSKPKNP